MELLLTTAILALATIVLVETTLRIYHRFFLTERFYQPSKRSLYSIHPDLSSHLPSEARFIINSWGERGDEPPRVNRLYRGLVLGGSAAECGLLDQDQAWPAQIQSLLRQAIRSGLLPADDAYVGAMCRPGLDVRGLRLALQRLQPFHPPLDFILIHSGPSDFARWTSFGTAPDGSFPPNLSHEVLSICRDTSFGFRPQSTALVYYLKRLVSTLWRNRIHHRKIGRMPIDERKLRQSSRPHVPLPASSQPFLDSYRAGMLDLIAEARLHCRHVIVLPQLWLDPAACATNPDSVLWFGRWNRHQEPKDRPVYIDHAEIERLFQDVYSINVETATAAGVHLFDLKDVFPQDLTNFYDDDHFTPAGAALTGRLVADRIIRIESSSAT